MTISTTTNKVTGAGNGGATEFSFSPFTVFAASELLVVKVDSAGVETTLTEGVGETNYSVSLSTPSKLPSRGHIVYPATGTTNILALNDSIVIKRVLAIEQSLDLTDRGDYNTSAMEGEFDKGVMISLQQQDDISRSIKGPVSDTVSAELPNQADRSSTWLAFDSTGVPVAAAASASGVTPYTTTLVGSISSAAAISTLEVVSASTTAAGIVELSTTAEAETGSSASVVITPESLHDMTTLSGAAWLLDDDSFTADSATLPASQQSIKAYVAANGTTFSQQTFDTSGTWTKPGTGTWAIIECWGGGGSGAAYNGGQSGGGGGGGAYTTMTKLLSELSATEAVTVGAGGAAVSGTNVGNAGGTSDFATLIYAYGGGGGNQSSNDGGGGGGGGALSAGGAAGINGGGNVGGSPSGGALVAAAVDGKDAADDGGGGGGGGRDLTSGSGGGNAVNGGGGGGGGSTVNANVRSGGSSYMGGGGGAGASSGTGQNGNTGGTSIGGGRGGDPQDTTVAGEAGQAPAGGGAGSNTADSGAGAAGRVRVTVW